MHVRKLFDYSVPMVAAATVLAVGIIALGVLGGYTAYKIRIAGDTVVVTGSAKEAVTADFARWTINLDTTTGIGMQQSGLDRLEQATQRIMAYLAEKEFSDIEIPAPNVSVNYSYPERSAPVMTGYNVSRQIIVRSPDVDRIVSLANNLAPLSGPLYNVTTYGVELTYQQLDETRVALLSAAIADARARAASIAKDGGRSVGALKNASSGVVQVLPRGGVDISDYGTYDTQSKEKEVMVTVRATFALE